MCHVQLIALLDVCSPDALCAAWPSPSGNVFMTRSEAAAAQREDLGWSIYGISVREQWKYVGRGAAQRPSGSASGMDASHNQVGETLMGDRPQIAGRHNADSIAISSAIDSPSPALGSPSRSSSRLPTPPSPAHASQLVVRSPDDLHSARSCATAAVRRAPGDLIVTRPSVSIPITDLPEPRCPCSPVHPLGHFPPSKRPRHGPLLPRLLPSLQNAFRVPLSLAQRSRPGRPPSSPLHPLPQSPLVDWLAPSSAASAHTREQSSLALPKLPIWHSPKCPGNSPRAAFRVLCTPRPWSP